MTIAFGDGNVNSIVTLSYPSFTCPITLAVKQSLESKIIKGVTNRSLHPLQPVHQHDTEAVLEAVTVVGATDKGLAGTDVIDPHKKCL
jgi:hypothetical protein